jgi:hypothetical protein
VKHNTKEVRIPRKRKSLYFSMVGFCAPGRVKFEK